MNSAKATQQNADQLLEREDYSLLYLNTNHLPPLLRPIHSYFHLLGNLFSIIVCLWESGAVSWLGCRCCRMVLVTIWFGSFQFRRRWVDTSRLLLLRSSGRVRCVLEVLEVVSREKEGERERRWIEREEERSSKLTGIALCFCDQCWAIESFASSFGLFVRSFVHPFVFVFGKLNIRICRQTDSR